MPKPRGGQRQQYNNSSGSSGSRFQALNDYQNGGIFIAKYFFIFIFNNKAITVYKNDVYILLKYN